MGTCVSQSPKTPLVAVAQDGNCTTGGDELSPDDSRYITGKRPAVCVSDCNGDGTGTTYYETINNYQESPHYVNSYSNYDNIKDRDDDHYYNNSQDQTSISCEYDLSADKISPRNVGKEEEEEEEDGDYAEVGRCYTICHDQLDVENLLYRLLV